MNKVEILFSERAIIDGGTHLFSKQDALEFIQECKKFNIGILGIDAYFFTETYIRPSMADSIEYSMDLSNKNYDYNGALKFVIERDENLVFEIVCEEL